MLDYLVMGVSLPLMGFRFSISGSAGDTSSGHVDRVLLQRCHAFVYRLTLEILRAGGEVVAFIGNEPRMDPERADSAKIFYWTQLDAVMDYLPERTKTHTGRSLVALVVAMTQGKYRIPPHRLPLWERLLEHEGAVKLIHIAERHNVGGHHRERQAEDADVLITLGGGKGVFELNRLFRARQGAILPLDAPIGSSCNDGCASRELNQEAFEAPAQFVPSALTSWFVTQLPRLTFESDTPPDELAQRVLHVLLRLAPELPKCAFDKHSPAAIDHAHTLTLHDDNRRPLGTVERSRLPEHIHFLVLADEWSQHKGGISSFNQDLCKALARAGHHVSLFIPQSSLSAQDRAEITRIDGITLVDTKQQSVTDESELVIAPTLCASPDVIVGHGAITGEAARVQREKYFPKSLLVHLIHVSPNDTEHQKNKSVSAAMTTAEQKDQAQAMLSGAADLVVAIGPLLERSIQESLHAWKQTAPVHLMLPWLQSHELCDAPKSKACLFIGRAESHYAKGLDLAVRALCLLGDRPRLYVRGVNNTSAERLEQLVRTWSDGKIEFHPQEYATEPARIDASYRRATVVLMPSRSEGFGLVGLEAIARGIPALVTADSGLGELLKTHGGELGRSTVVRVTGNDEETITELHRKLAPIWESPGIAFKNAQELLELLRPHLDEQKIIKEFIDALRSLSAKP